MTKQENEKAEEIIRNRNEDFSILTTNVTKQERNAEKCQRLKNQNLQCLKLKLKQGGIIWDAMGFNLGKYAGELASYIDVVYNIELDRWNGEERLRLTILDFSYLCNIHKGPKIQV